MMKKIAGMSRHGIAQPPHQRYNSIKSHTRPGEKKGELPAVCVVDFFQCNAANAGMIRAEEIHRDHGMGYDLLCETENKARRPAHIWRLRMFTISRSMTFEKHGYTVNCMFNDCPKGADHMNTLKSEITRRIHHPRRVKVSKQKKGIKRGI